MKGHTSDCGMKEKTQNWFNSAANNAIDHGVKKVEPILSVLKVLP